MYYHDLLKNEIIEIKKTIARSSSRTRYIVILLSDVSVLDDASLDDRLANIRRATALDPKTSLLFVPPNSSYVELRAFARTALSTFQPLCIEYYRDLSKHARRKRNRAAVPPPTVPPFRGTSQTLSGQGWNVRYDFKLGVFAEFRQEMDAAARHYDGAYDTLLSPDIFESIAVWSPRWNEARLLADIIAVRVLRCLLWNGQTSSAVMRWQSHRVRMRDLVDQRGKGSSNYGWAAWEARWATVMAELLQELALPKRETSDVGPGSSPVAEAIYAEPEKAFPVGERIAPWQHLHHPGYWLDLATRHVLTRRRYTQMIPEEDRAPPGQSPASQVASRSYLYDTYLCPEPHVEAPLPGHEGVSHSALIQDAIGRTMHEFGRRGQKRFLERLQFASAKELMRVAQWSRAMQLLRPLWQRMSWRQEGWWGLVEEVSWALRDCAQHTGDGASLVSVEWELLNDFFTPRPGWTYDLANCLKCLPPLKTKALVTLRAGDIASFLVTSYTFRDAESNVGDYLPSQLTVRSRAHRHALPVRLSQIRLDYEGAFGSVIVGHQDSHVELASNAGHVHYIEVPIRDAPSAEIVQEPKPAMAGEADLTLRPGETKIFNFACLLREAGEIQATSATLTLKQESFTVDYVIPLKGKAQSELWWLKGARGVKKQKLVAGPLTTTKVLPKPPKMELSLVDQKAHYYTGEQIAIMVELVNGEDEEIEGWVKAQVLGDEDDSPHVVWQASSEGDESSARGKDALGKLASLAKRRRTLSFVASSQPVDYVVEVTVLYHHVSDPDTPLSKTLTTTLSVRIPFTATWVFSPQVHPAPWPSYFVVAQPAANDGDAAPQGIIQMWSLAAELKCLPATPLVLLDAQLRVDAITSGAVCRVVERQGSAGSPLTDGVWPLQFTVEIQKLELDDRRSTSVDLALDVKWQRPESDVATPTTTTEVSVPRLVVASGEPRVLASVRRSSAVPGLIQVDYSIENPSMHLLTFQLTMESSEDFAFHGPKASTLQLLPLSRHTVCFNLFPTVRETWIQPNLRVVDRFFNKTLKIQATEGMKVDPKGVSIWVGS
ncbi:MAG: hypothetical protein M1826_005412 [Phylliscum demangeonii]|nr:MAG: hypothetical protein M1826_005412 [Phylliscum demangeonii]